jgi:hypothetical protein
MVFLNGAVLVKFFCTIPLLLKTTLNPWEEPLLITVPFPPVSIKQCAQYKNIFSLHFFPVAHLVLLSLHLSLRPDGPPSL